MVLTKFQDKSLRGLLVGVILIKLLKGECNISRPVRRSINAVKIDFLILKNLGKSLSTVDFMWKDIDEKNEHFHFFPKNDRVGIGLVVTDETKLRPNPDRHIPVDNQKFFEVFGRELNIYFKNEREILDITTSKFDKCRIITYKPEVTVDKVQKKILHLNLAENEIEVTPAEFKKTNNVLGIIINEQGEVNDFVVKKENKIHCFNYNALRKISLELFPVLKENYPHSKEKI
jgi:hypothetical protein